MKYLFVLFLIVHKLSVVAQQSQPKIYPWNIAKNALPDTIFGITFEKMKLKEVPKELQAFKQLNTLLFSNNKLSQLPDFMGEFNKLQSLDISKNNFTVFPAVICQLTELKRFIANRNPMEYLPECVGYCEKLVYVDLWDTPIGTFPTSFKALKNLKKLDLQGISYPDSFQKELKEQMPTVEILFDAPCNCLR
jgi:hypothetical protein